MATPTENGAPKSMGRMLKALSKYTSPLTRTLSEHLDAWVNTVTGVGTTSDKSTYGQIMRTRILVDEELASLYHADDIAARMVDIVPQEMLREPFSVETGNPDLDIVIQEKFEALNVRGALADGVRWGRLFGGGCVLIGADDGADASKPLVPERCKDVNYLYPVDRRLLWPITYYDTYGHPKFGRPETYMVNTIGGFTYNTQTVHESRLLIFRGVPTGIRERHELLGWDMSVLQRAFNVLRSFDTAWSAVEQLLIDGNQAIFKMSGLAEAIESGNQDALYKRLQIISLYRSVMRALVIDADQKEEFVRNAANFTAIPDVLDKIMLRTAAAVEVPVTILMGQSPAGMNATGESDFRWFYDRIRAKQNSDLTPHIRRIAEVWLKSKASPLSQSERNEWFPDATKGITGLAKKKGAKSINVKYVPLWSETPLTQAQRNLAVAQMDAVYVNAQVYTPDEIALTRGKPGGMEDEIVLTDEGRDARESGVKIDLEEIAKGTQEPPIAKGGGAPGMGGAKETGAFGSKGESRGGKNPLMQGEETTQKAFEKANVKNAVQAAKAQNKALRGDTVEREDYNPNHEPAGSPEGGRFASGDGGGGSKEAAHVAGQLTKVMGSHPYGFSWRPGTGHAQTGVMVSEHPNKGMNVPIPFNSKMGKNELRGVVKAYVKAHLALVKSNPKMHFGGWKHVDKETGAVTFHLDISRQYSQEEKKQAIEAGRQNNQIAIYDIDRGEEIPTGGTGKPTK